MENWVVLHLHLQDHDYCKTRRVSVRRAERKHPAFTSCSCCRNDGDSEHRHPAPAPGRKRKRASVGRPASRHSGQGDVGPLSPISSDELPPVPEHKPAPAPGRKRKRAAVGRPASKDQDDVGPRSPIPPEDLPTVLSVAPRDESSPAPLPDTDPVMIHHRSVSEYQQIYHEVVDDMLRYKNGRPRPYSLELGRLIKQKLWERLQRPSFTESVSESGLIQVNPTYGVGTNPPQYDVDVSCEPQPETRPKKRRKT